MGPITVLDALEKRKFFCGRPFRNLVTILADLTNKSKTTTTTTTTTKTLVMEAVEVVVQHQLR
jgi:predicted alpha-1,6-mannanase (GH76 family)